MVGEEMREPFDSFGQTYVQQQASSCWANEDSCVCVCLNQGVVQHAIEIKPITMRVIRWMYAHILIE